MRTFEYERLIAKMYNLSFINRFPPRFNRLVAAIARVVTCDLAEGGFIRSVDAPMADMDHTRRLLRLTVLRPIHSRGRTSGMAVNEDKLRRQALQLAECLNGDWRRPLTTHYCPGLHCCRDERHCADRIVSLLIEIFLDSLHTCSPSSNKWWTFEPSMVPVVGLMSCHQLLQRAAPSAWGQESEEAADEGEQEELDGQAAFRRNCAKKARSTFECVTSGDSDQEALIALWATEPLEHLNHNLQHVDSKMNMNALLDATDPCGPIFQAQTKLWNMITSNDAADLPLSFLLRHFEHLGSEGCHLACCLLMLR